MTYVTRPPKSDPEAERWAREHEARIQGHIRRIAALGLAGEGGGEGAPEEPRSAQTPQALRNGHTQPTARQSAPPEPCCRPPSGDQPPLVPPLVPPPVPPPVPGPTPEPDPDAYPRGPKRFKREPVPASWGLLGLDAGMPYWPRGHDWLSSCIRGEVIHRLLALGWSASAIARHLGLDHSTIAYRQRKQTSTRYAEVRAAWDILQGALAENPELMDRTRTGLIRRPGFVERRKAVWTEMFKACGSWSVVGELCEVRHTTVLAAVGGRGRRQTRLATKPAHVLNANNPTDPGRYPHADTTDDPAFQREARLSTA